MDEEPRVSDLLRGLQGHPGRDALLERMESLLKQEDKGE